ncbi:MAG: tripartite tricarboxylate transporter substrate binding protein [Alphaproteobacteria bacterium]
MMRAIALVIGFFALLLPPQPAAAQQQYPTKPIRMVMPAAAGNTSDAYVRAVARDIESRLGQPIVVENLVGGGGVIGTRAVARAAPDGYTIGWVSASYLSHHLTSKEPQYRWPDDFTFVHKGTSVQVVLAASTKAPFKTARELIDYAKANPRKVKAANPGLFNHSFINSKRFQTLTGIAFTDVNYRASTDSVRSVFIGETDLTFVAKGPVLPGVEAGAIRILALLNEAPDPRSPEIPTLRSMGINQVSSVFQGFTFPGNTPPAIVERWYQEISKANQSAEVQKMVEAQGLIVETASREDMIRSVNEDITALETVMKELKLEPQ